jgi:hypothetical protein
MKELGQKQILSVGFIASVFLLLLNDFYLKVVFPGIISGKLSDFAGLFAFPLFFSALLPKKKVWIYIVTGLAFILWKLPITDNFISFWDRYMPYSIGRVIDYTDYLALFILPVSYFYNPTRSLQINNHIKKLATLSIVSLTVFSFLATAGTHGRIKGYEFNYSKYELSQAIQKFYENYPECAVPSQYYEMINPHFFGSPNDDKVSRLNADSVNFNFYFEDLNIILWSSFVGSEENWMENRCELVLEGYFVIPEGKWKFNNDLTKEEKQNITTLFQKEILERLMGILKEPHPSRLG